MPSDVRHFSINITILHHVTLRVLYKVGFITLILCLKNYYSLSFLTFLHAYTGNYCNFNVLVFFFV